MRRHIYMASERTATGSATRKLMLYEGHFGEGLRFSLCFSLRSFQRWKLRRLVPPQRETF